MERDSPQTREKLLDAAESAILEKGFGATSIDELIAAVGITKSGFFYHFKGKSALAEALLRRYLERERILLDQVFGRADKLHEDPLQSLLFALSLLAELLEDLPEGNPGCLMAAYCYQDQLFNREVRDLHREALLAWRRRFALRIDAIAERHPPRRPIRADDLADHLGALIDGGMIVGKALDDDGLLPRQLLLYRDFLADLFASRR
ncbi:MAG: hypothetical protein Kilf2KO_02260 [Rhodospirillales bacterium]